MSKKPTRFIVRHSMLIKIEVAFATAELQKVISLELESNCTLLKAIHLSQINQFFPEYDFTQLALGVFGKRIFKPEEYQLKDGDRIEIYRSLNKTPNQKRLERAKNI